MADVKPELAILCAEILDKLQIFRDLQDTGLEERVDMYGYYFQKLYNAVSQEELLVDSEDEGEGEGEREGDR